jgi:hypothetical protein
MSPAASESTGRAIDERGETREIRRARSRAACTNSAARYARTPNQRVVVRSAAASRCR